MTRLAGRRLLAAAAAAGLMGAATAADPAPAGRSWYERLTGTPHAAPADGTFGAPAPPVRYAPLDPAALQEAYKAEADALARRLEVCTQLQRVAAAKGDEKLLARAAELELQASAVYKGRVARLGVKTTGGVQ